MINYPIPKALVLRFALREVWEVPAEDQFINTGSDWFLDLLAKFKVQMVFQLMFLFWRAWHIQNDGIFAEGGAPFRLLS